MFTNDITSDTEILKLLLDNIKIHEYAQQYYWAKKIKNPTNECYIIALNVQEMNGQKVKFYDTSTIAAKTSSTWK